eukprot:Opistho-2@73002
MASAAQTEEPAIGGGQAYARRMSVADDVLVSKCVVSTLTQPIDGYMIAQVSSNRSRAHLKLGVENSKPRIHNRTLASSWALLWGAVTKCPLLCAVSSKQLHDTSAAF